MNLSLGEFQALVAKAFRGAGYPWGLTEDASYAARRLAQFGYPSGEIVVSLLHTVDDVEPQSLMPDNAWRSTGALLCPVCVGVSIADLGGIESVETSPVQEPELLAPLLAHTVDAANADGYVISWNGGSCSVGAAGISSTGERPDGAVAVSIVRRDVEAESTATSTRVDLSAPTFDSLATLAHRIYAPATEASRLGGAGAGTTDND